MLNFRLYTVRSDFNHSSDVAGQCRENKTVCLFACSLSMYPMYLDVITCSDVTKGYNREIKYIDVGC